MQLHFEVMDDQGARAISFGNVSSPEFVPPDDWEAAKSTLFDPRIFGWNEDWICACGRTTLQNSGEAICAWCGVRIGKACALRHTRFGHIELGRKVMHPFVPASYISALPVIPIAFRCDAGESDLNFLYSRVLNSVRSASLQGSLDDLSTSIQQLLANEVADPTLHYDGRVVRSLSFYGFESVDRTLRDTGTYVTALGLRVVIR